MNTGHSIYKRLPNGKYRYYHLWHHSPEKRREILESDLFEEYVYLRDQIHKCQRIMEKQATTRTRMDILQAKMDYMQDVLARAPQSLAVLGFKGLKQGLSSLDEWLDQELDICTNNETDSEIIYTRPGDGWSPLDANNLNYDHDSDPDPDLGIDVASVGSLE